MKLKNCLICNAKIIRQRHYPYDSVCPNKVKLPNGKEYHHYYFQHEEYHTRLYYLPFKIIADFKFAEIYHQKKNAGKKSTSPQFKKFLTIPTEKLPFHDGPALFNKLKTLLLFT